MSSPPWSASSTTRPAPWSGTRLRKPRTPGRYKFYPDAEAVLARLPRRGPPLILQAKRNGNTGPYKPNRMAKLVRKLADSSDCPRASRWTPAGMAA